MAIVGRCFCRSPHLAHEFYVRTRGLGFLAARWSARVSLCYLRLDPRGPYQRLLFGLRRMTPPKINIAPSNIAHALPIAPAVLALFGVFMTRPIANGDA